MANTISMRKQEEQWQVEDDMRTLMRAKEIQADPKRLKAVQAMAKDKLLELANVAGQCSDSDD